MDLLLQSATDRAPEPCHPSLFERPHTWSKEVVWLAARSRPKDRHDRFLSVPESIVVGDRNRQFVRGDLTNNPLTMLFPNLGTQFTGLSAPLFPLQQVLQPTT